MRIPQKLIAEVVLGECQECGMLGPVISIGNKTLCEDCEKEFKEAE